MSININDPAARREDLVAALKALLDPPVIVVTDMAWGSALVPGDGGNVFWFSDAATITLPNNLDLPLNFKVGLRRLGPAPTIAVAAGAVLAPAITTIVGQYLSASATVVAKTETSVTWVVEGAVG